MAARKPLRAVTEADKPAAPKSVTEAASNGTTRELYIAMRTRIAEAVEDRNTPARELAALTKRLAEVVNSIEAIDAREEQEAGTRGPVEDGTYDPTAI